MDEDVKKKNLNSTYIKAITVVCFTLKIPKGPIDF